MHSNVHYYDRVVSMESDKAHKEILNNNPYYKQAMDDPDYLFRDIRTGETVDLRKVDNEGTAKILKALYDEKDYYYYSDMVGVVMDNI